MNSLTRTLEATGTIAYEPALAVQSTLTGTVLEIVAPGDTVSSGDVLARIDDSAIVWLDGELPAWRSLDVGDEGDDVEQLETELTNLGFNDGDVTVDDEYTEATAAMVERWQESLGLEPTGDVELGTVVFSGDRNRVAAVEAAVGDRVSPGALIHLGSDDRVADLAVAPADAVHLAIGDEIEAVLPDRTAVTATVTGIVEASEIWTVTAAVDGVDLAARDTITIEANWEYTIAADVLTVPSSALLRLDDGRYVVDVVDEGGGLDRRQVALRRVRGHTHADRVRPLGRRRRRRPLTGSLLGELSISLSRPAEFSYVATRRPATTMPFSARRGLPSSRVRCKR